MTNTLYDTPSHRELVLDSAPTADGVVLYHPEHTGPDQPEHWLISDVFVERTEAR